MGARREPGRRPRRASPLKHELRPVDTPEVKLCPHCSGELRDSVIRCVHCGRNLREEPEREHAGVAVPGPEGALAPNAAPIRPAPVARPTPAAPPAPRPVPTPVPAPAPRRATEPRSVAVRTSPLGNPAEHRALPTKRRSLGLDLWMLWAGMAAATAGVLAHLAVREPWVHLIITDTVTDDTETRLLELALKGDAAFVGAAASVLGIALAVLGALWFVFGFQRGWTVPSFVSPALGLLVTAAGIGLTVLSSMVWFAWEDAMVFRANVAGVTSGEMRTLLDHQPTPLVEIHRLSGLMSFAAMMVLGLLASSLAWWAYRRREA